jgi:hypothetical protein
LDLLEHALVPGETLADHPGAIGIVPEVCGGGLLTQFVEFGTLALQIEELASLVETLSKLVCKRRGIGDIHGQVSI